MRSLRFCGLGVIVLGMPVFSAPQGRAQDKSGSQQTAAVPAGNPQAVLLASQAQAALTGDVSVTDLLLTADINWTAGGTKSRGTAILKAKGTREARVDISGDTIKRMEIHNHTSGPD